MSECFLPGSPPKEVVDYFRKKTQQSAYDWRDIWREENIASFQVAKAMSADVQRELYEAIDRAISDGVPFQQFKKDLVPKLQKLGWWGETEVIDPKTGEKKLVNITPYRLQRIYDTNISTAYAAGRWEKIQRTKSVFPYLLYQLGASREHRVDHVDWAGTVLPVDHEFWHQHYPPNGWGCKCRTKQISRSEYKKILEQGASTGEFTQKLGKDGKPTGHIEPIIRPVKTEAPKTEMVEWTNKRTGKTYMIPKGIDPGFGMNWGMRGGGCGGMVETNSELLLPDSDLILVLNASSSAAKSCNLLSKEQKLKESEAALAETEQKLKNKYQSLTPENSDKFLTPSSDTTVKSKPKTKSVSKPKNQSPAKEATPVKTKQQEIDFFKNLLENPADRDEWAKKYFFNDKEALLEIEYRLSQLDPTFKPTKKATTPAWLEESPPWAQSKKQQLIAEAEKDLPKIPDIIPFDWDLLDNHPYLQIRYATKYGLTIDEFREIKAYTGDGLYAEINHALRTNTVTPKLQERINRISSGLAKLPSYSGYVKRDVAIARSNTREVISQFIPGKISAFSGFTSTSKDRDISNFAAKNSNEHTISFNIKSTGKKGHEIENMSDHSYEKEVLFDKDSAFVVKSVKWKKPGMSSEFQNYDPNKHDDIPEGAEFVIELEEI